MALMALILSISTCEGCDEFTFTDSTGLYSDPENLSGYGTENGISSPSDFTSYILEIRYPGTPITADPDATYDLLADVPPIDPDDDYVWTITAADIGLTKFVSGVYTFTARGVLAGNTYLADAQCIFKNDLQGLIDTAMLDWDPTCPCKAGCEGLDTLYTQFLTVVCGGKCDPVATQSIINSQYHNLPCNC